MNSEDKRKINNNLSSLIERTQLDSGSDSDLKTKLIEKNVFAAHMLEKILASGKDSHSKKRELYVSVQKRGPHAFDQLLEALIESGNIEAARILDPDIPTPVNIGGGETRSSIVFNEPTYDTPGPAAPAPPVWHNNTTPLSINVVRHQSAGNTVNTHIRAYKMDSQPRGLALIINNENFDNEILATRTGSLVDFNNLDQLFLQLGFKVTLRRNLGYSDMINEIQKFASKDDHNDVDMCAVVILSHGRHGLVSAADGRELETEWVLRQFNNEGCPALRGKPKFFILQSCRGDEADYGVLPKIEFNENRSGFDARVIDMPPGSSSSSRPVYKELSWEDMIVSYATLPGYVANRDRYRGTWYIECLCKVFMEHAHNLEIREMLDMVAEYLKNYESELGTKQSCSYEVRNFYKKLYFNP